MTGGDAGGWALGMGAGLGNNSTRLISASDSLRLDHRARCPPLYVAGGGLASPPPPPIST